MPENRHADDGVDKRDQGQQGPDIEERWKTDDKGEEQLADTFRGLDEPQDSADSEHPHDSQERRGHREIYHNVFHQNTQDGRQHKQEVEQIPGHREVMITQTYYFDDRFQAENGREKRVRHFEDEEDGMRLIVVLDPHRQHVEKYQNEDSYFESGKSYGRSDRIPSHDKPVNRSAINRYSSCNIKAMHARL